mgnify:CR=1 FL=1
MIGNAWEGTGWYFNAKSADEVMMAIAKIGAHGGNHRFCWRGLSDSNYNFTSSLHRRLDDEVGKGELDAITEEVLRDREDKILEKARDWGLGVAGGHLVDDLQLLADLQHYGVPTRLIDVTSNPMTALWFATAQPSTRSRGARGALIALNMNWYRDAGSGGGSGEATVFKTVGRPPMTAGDVEDGLAARRNAALSLDTPFVVSASIPNPRLRAQEGYFVASSYPDNPKPPLQDLKVEYRGGDADELRDLLLEPKKRGLPRSLPFVAIFIPSAVKGRLRKYLKLNYSRTAKRLFPDYEGFCRYGNI